MITAIGGNNSIQMYNALNAFKATKNVNIGPKNTDTPDGINLKDNDNLLEKINLAEVKNCAKRIGENISNDDIKYGLTYGRSVIANYIV